MREPEPQMTEEQPLDDVVREIIAEGEAGVADLMAVYERIEQRYIAAVVAATGDSPGLSYSTHT